MKKKKLVLIASFCAVSLAAILGGAYFQGIIDEYERKSLPLPENFTVTAHTGSSYTEDNSLASIRYAAENADIAELDLNFTSEGVPVLSHDEPKGGEVTLDEAFSVVAEYEKLRVNVDLKSDMNLAAVQTLAEKHGVVDRIFFTGIDTPERAEKARETCPNVKYYLNINVDKNKSADRDYLLSLVNQVKELGAIGINFNKDSASGELCEVFHSEGLLVSVWTVDNELDMHRIISFGPDNITTRKPVRVNEIILGIRS